jgi:hypothetical protein
MGDQQSIWLGRARKMDQLLVAVLEVNFRETDLASLHHTASRTQGAS